MSVRVHMTPRSSQSYRYATPRWVKVYTALLFDDTYRNLTPVQRSALHGLELLFALTGKPVPLDVKSLNTKLGLRTNSETWESLNHAGLIAFASTETVHQSRGEQREKAEESTYRAETETEERR